ncbi:hypothetical protein GDO81_004965 [Engystomops pustulosus]|uniref:Uncharacterized protein n=1 Tax=Engystomops pustulosus TaxID=76066 RepID=A0AAV7CJT1_ENGPU|nr:hypothetical protein GDO81_004965 [Engystomops pustulosus]
MSSKNSACRCLSIDIAGMLPVLFLIPVPFPYTWLSCHQRICMDISTKASKAKAHFSLVVRKHIKCLFIIKSKVAYLVGKGVMT